MPESADDGLDEDRAVPAVRAVAAILGLSVPEVLPP
jgi:hypothetical protein